MKLIVAFILAFLVSATVVAQVTISSEQIQHKEKCIYHGRGYNRIVTADGVTVTIKTPSEIKGYCLYYSSDRGQSGYILFREKDSQYIRQVLRSDIEKKEWKD